MDSKEFRERGYEMVDYVVNYLESVSQRRVSPDVSPGFLISAFPPTTPPETGDSFQKIVEDIEKYIMPGITHWQHPGFHAYLPSPCSFPALLGNMMADILSIVSLNWDFSPCGSELEITVLNWYGKMIGLPESFLHYGYSNRGSGIMQRSSSECIFMCMITARQQVLKKLKHKNPSMSKAILLSSMVAYCSKESQSSIEETAIVTLVNVRVLDADKDNRLRGETLARAIEADMKIGLIPFFVNITLGTFSSGSCDPISEIGPICKKYNVWLNVDATYGGNALVCPEFRYLLLGIEYASSFNVSPACWMLTHADCSVLFVQDRYKLKDAVIVDRTSYGYNFSEKDWSYPNNTEYYAIKFFFVIRNYGVEGLQNHIRNHIKLAEMFEDCVKSDERFEFISRQFGIVCFRLKGTDERNRFLNSVINGSGKLFMSPTRLGEKYAIRFIVCTERANEDDIRDAWNVICEQADKVLKKDPKEIIERLSQDIYEEIYTSVYGF